MFGLTTEYSFYSCSKLPVAAPSGMSFKNIAGNVGYHRTDELRTGTEREQGEAAKCVNATGPLYEGGNFPYIRGMYAPAQIVLCIYAVLMLFAARLLRSLWDTDVPHRGAVTTTELVWNVNRTYQLPGARNGRQQLLFVWSSLEEEVPANGVQALSSASANRLGIPVLCFCATQQCVRQLQALALPNARVFRMGMPDLMALDSPLLPWFSKVPLIKIWSGPRFPEYLQLATELLMLYHHGGLLTDWGLELVGPAEAWPLDGEALWCHEVAAGGARLLYAPPRSRSVALLLEAFVHFFDTFDPSREELLHLPHEWSKGCPGASTYMPPSSADAVAASYQVLKKAPMSQSLARKRHFGQMWPDLRTNNRWFVANLGDEVQGLASVQWLPYVDRRVDRDLLDAVFKEDGPTLTFLNAWYGAPSMRWPPSVAIDPILISMHVAPAVRGIFSSNASVKYLTSRQPIGARDSSTLAFLKSLGVGAYLSYCMTLTLQKLVHVRKDPACRILVVDVDPAFTGALPREILPWTCSASADWVDSNRTGEIRNGLSRYGNAYALLERYASANLVVTSRLHAALPSASFGIPVVLVLDERMPGGGGVSDNYARFSDFQDLFHTFHVRGSENISAFVGEFPWSKPPPNPGHSRLAEVRCQIFANIINSHPEMSDWIEYFDGRSAVAPCGGHASTRLQGRAAQESKDFE